MLLLSIDTSGKNGSIALAIAPVKGSPGEVEVVAIMPIEGGTFSAQLVPQISDLLTRQGFTRYDLAAMIVVAGPGSFTGLRVGLAAVMALAEVLDKPIVALSLLEVCVFASGASGKVMAALDAGRNEVYVGEYETGNAAQKRERLLTRDEFLAGAKGWTVATPDAALAEAARAVNLTVIALPPLSAAEAARLGWGKLQAGQTLTADQLEANYIRRTDAEIAESRK
ncbi:MAG TPA: tRNA (adenosine(37)-N6)-threonylcarbamoyltransferase complex dimerization subunit type 1 TsaB [Candidatus Binatia bacterium]|nr:tRNA (adenosine(37)-N6)-threonylcarbamoyltransferase complex dimerization subunit type 1 TsaB [Candidatus Binatia bacterium]